LKEWEKRVRKVWGAHKKNNKKGRGKETIPEIRSHSIKNASEKTCDERRRKAATRTRATKKAKIKSRRNYKPQTEKTRPRQTRPDYSFGDVNWDCRGKASKRNLVPNRLKGIPR